MLVDYIRQINAKQTFKITPEFDFLDFDDITTELNANVETPEHLELWASVKIHYEGEIPESYKTLNLMIGDWVESNVEKLTDVIHKNLAQHFQENYSGSDASELHGSEESAIWLDQLDYMPRVDEDAKTITIEIELLLEAEPLEDE